MRPVSSACWSDAAASMRPRRIRRGTKLTFPGKFITGTCFNEAPANSPGNGYWCLTRGRIRRRFNEAPANSPGNDAQICADLAMLALRFNEAPANSPGNGRTLQFQFMDRSGFNEAPANSPGNAPTPSGARRPPPPRFNEAPANSPGNAARTPSRGDSGPVASMRPRRIRRGTSRKSARGRSPRPRASMRPRRIRRGTVSRPRAEVARDPRALQ